MFRNTQVGFAMILVAFTLSSTTACTDSEQLDDDGGEVAGRDLDGTWATACYNNGFAFVKTTLTYDDLALVGTFEEFEDDQCVNASHITRWTATATIAGTTTTGETMLDLAFETFESTALTAANADFNNMNFYCGFADWAANVEKDVLGADCYGYSIPVGGESLDIYVVEGDTLKFGQGALIGVDLSEEQRPTAIDENAVFTKS